MNTVILPEVVVTATATNVPAKTEYWCGYDMYCECAVTGDWLSAEEFASMTPQEKRGYEAAGRHQADCQTDDYLISLNVNAYGDYTQGGGF